MADEALAPRSRRSVMAALAGGALAAAAAALGRPLPAKADIGTPINMGDHVTGLVTTWFDTTGVYDGDAILATSGGTALHGTSPKGTGVFGETTTPYGGTGVIGTSVGGIGVIGFGHDAGMSGKSATGPGIVGYSGSDQAYPTQKTGVYGFSSTDENAVGVTGESTAGTGVNGTATTGLGVRATSDSGSAVQATSNAGTGLDATSANGTAVRASTTSGVALQVVGKASFSRSGRVTAGKNKSYVDAVVPGGVATTALCFANLAAFRTGVYVAAVRPAYPSATKIRIYFNKPLPAATVVAWVVLN